MTETTKLIHQYSTKKTRTKKHSLTNPVQSKHSKTRGAIISVGAPLSTPSLIGPFTTWLRRCTSNRDLSWCYLALFAIVSRGFKGGKHILACRLLGFLMNKRRRMKVWVETIDNGHWAIVYSEKNILRSRLFYYLCFFFIVCRDLYIRSLTYNTLCANRLPVMVQNKTLYTQSRWTSRRFHILGLVIVWVFWVRNPEN